MRWAKDHSRVWYAVMFAALATLIPLAWMQYRLISQMSDAENERMHSHLSSSMQRLSRDFEAEIGRIYRLLMVGPQVSPEVDMEELGSRYVRWRETDASRQIIRDLYFARESASGIELLRFDSKTNQFAQCAWPPQLAPLRARLAGDAPIPSFSSMNSEVPLIVIPRWRRRGPGAESSPDARWAIAEINLRYIQTDFLPELVKKNLPIEGGVDYQVRVVNRGDPAQVLYVSDSNLPADFFKSVDEQIPLLFARPGMGAFRSPGPGEERDRPRDRDHNRDLHPRESRQRSEFGMGFGGPRMEGPGPGSGGPGRGGPGPGPGFGPPREFAEARGGWLLQVKHRAGSLEEAVAQARRRNLAISFAILLIMGATLLMLLVSTQRAQRLAKLQMEFVAGVSHELRTPLTVICSAGDNLADGVVASEQQVRRYGSVIRNEGRRLSQMVEQILGFAGIQNGRTKYEMQPVDVAQMIARALNACEPEIRASACRLETNIEPNLPLVSGDPTSLMHCLRNLIDNAARYGRAGDWIGVFAHTVSGPKGTEIEIRIEDHGPGIEPSEQQRIFDPFYRGQKSVEDQIHGFGLGLALVKRIVVAHSGAISLDSALGKGSSFAIRIPVSVQIMESTEISAIAGTEYGGTAHSAD